MPKRHTGGVEEQLQVFLNSALDGREWSTLFHLLYLWETTLVPTEQENGWAPEPVLHSFREDKSLAPAKIRTSDCLAHNIIVNMGLINQNDTMGHLIFSAPSTFS